jgi:hypothetical protein
MIAGISELTPIGLFLVFGIFVGLLAILNSPKRRK